MADFSCDITDPQLGLLWVEGVSPAAEAAGDTKRSSCSSSSTSSSGWYREACGGPHQHRALLHVGVREKAQRLHSRVLPVGRTVDALCPIEQASVVALACPAEVVVRLPLPSCFLSVPIRFLPGSFTGHKTEEAE